ncbi:arylamine N-acetyltransferase family protein [Albidovulum sediminis]|uniref:Arylamine N-acetyltransferase n=1 Tax=Albidovulum sediminis TaxID=3066345 RepID=A0ABT2NLA8_9RHOB|nr:arylamine N-acetyltransferase [Defluviimonas sediminis]MCT8328754.1 arylamine N-acetyltransferase [Defluviimonas sediminis]
MTFDLARYLARIGHAAESPSPAALARLQAAQLRTIAFENTDPFLGIVPDLDPDALQDKLIDQGRGGYCLELNALFGQALAALGYVSRPVLGRVRMGAAQGGPRAHLAHVVHFGRRRFLADTGFGGPAPEAPVEIARAAPVTDRLGRFRIRRDRGAGEWVLDRATPEGWFALYGFDGATVTDADRIAANFFCARHPGAPFPNHLMLNRVTGQGRVSLFDRHLSTADGARDLAGPEDLAAALRDDFALPADAALASRLWRRLDPRANAA